MIWPKVAFVLLSLVATNADNCASLLRCLPVTTPPTLDGDLGEWSDIEGVNTQIFKIGGIPYEPGNVDYKCLYDTTHIYFALEVPGKFRFNSTDNHQCAAIATMFKMGEKATYINMGGCPEAATGCDSEVPAACDAYRVDIGAHWELKDTEQGQAYPINVANGTGDDLVANKDDEYAVSPYCRFDDDGDGAGNEWAGAWVHSVPTTTNDYARDGGDTSSPGKYRFELSRLLETKSTLTDKQLAPGETYGFGIAYWDPNEVEETGWTDAGHYVTGCASQWIDLILVGEGGTEDSAMGPTKMETNSGFSFRENSWLFVVTMMMAAGGLLTLSFF